MCFGPKCSISGYRSCENGFAPNATILLHCKKMMVWIVLEQLKSLGNVKYTKLVFRA
jgi:hypothetical protein